MSKISNITKTYLPIAGAVGILFSVASWIFVQGYKKSVKDSGNVTIVSDIKVIKDSVLSISKQVWPMKTDLNGISEKLDNYAASHNALQQSYKQYLKDNIKLSKDLMIYVDDLIDLKKNMLYNQLIPYRQNETQYTLK